MLKKLKHRFYNALLSRGIVYNPKEVVPFNGQKIRASKGAFSRKGEKDDAWLYALSQHHSKILDIGCNIGQSSLLMLLKDPNEILCVDPNLSALARCAENLIDNGMINRARFVNAFVGAENDKPVQFYTSLVDAAGSKFAGFAKTSSSIGKSVYVNQK
jgi:SAM-dependent methyltransferase